MARVLPALCLLVITVISTNGGFAAEPEKPWVEDYLRFPPNFLLGAATAAYQIEGAWNVSDKAESVWDRYVHQSNHLVVDGSTGDDACKSYHKFKEDVAILKEIGFNSYRFSVSWSRILPEGLAHTVSQDGIRYYKELIDELVANDIEPILTLYHWDHPQVIEDAGGWLNPTVVDWFGDYSQVVFREFGDKVRLFITVNEPCLYCLYGYHSTDLAPGKTSLSGTAEYLCLQNMLKAHATAYRIYEQEFKETYGGSVGINIQMKSYYPKNAANAEAPERAFQFLNAWILNPLYSEEGDYPQIMKSEIARKSKEQGFSRSRLPELGPEWIKYIRGACDFVGISHYTSELVEIAASAPGPSFENDWEITTSFDPSWKTAKAPWQKVVPEGLGDVLRKLTSAYRNLVIYIAENGISTPDEIEDSDRVEYYQEYVKHMLVAINRDGVNVRGYLAWSLLDNFEWSSGYSERFGIVHVDFTDPERKRTLKRSARWWKDVIKNGGISSKPENIHRCQYDEVSETCSIVQ